MWKVSRRGVAAGRAEGKSLCARLAPSSGAQGSNGIQRRKQRPRMDKHERGFRLRGSGNQVVEGGRLMRFAGIDVGAERHMVAMVGEQGEVLFPVLLARTCRAMRICSSCSARPRVVCWPWKRQDITGAIYSSLR